MAKKLSLKSKKVVKLKKKPKTVEKIEKKPLTPKEREAKLRKDRIKIAKRYEEMKLYDEAIKYYKKLAMKDDVKRLMGIKREIYITKAQEFESAGKYEDAIRLFENLKMEEDVARVRRLMGDEDYTEEPAKEETVGEVEAAAAQDHTEVEPEQVEPQVDTGFDQAQETIIPDEQRGADKSKKVFKICPYCGEELNLPKNPNFCPYCKEAFV